MQFSFVTVLNISCLPHFLGIHLPSVNYDFVRHSGE